MTKYRFFFKYWLPVMIVAGAILWMSGSFLTYGYTATILCSLFPDISPQTLRLINGSMRGLAHVGEYFVLGVLLSRALFYYYGNRWNLRRSAMVVLLLAALALADEFFQSFFVLRNASLMNAGQDVSGAMLSQLAMLKKMFPVHRGAQPRKDVLS